MNDQSVPIAPRIEARKLENGDVAEFYITVRPNPTADLESQAREVFTAVRHALAQTGAQIFCERIFATTDAHETLEKVRKEVYGEIDDSVIPTKLAVEPGSYGRFAGVQVHAVRAPQAPVVLQCGGINEPTMGRKLQNNGSTWLYVNGLNAADAEVDPAEQARRVFYCTGCFLRQSGTTMKSVARTWLWLRDICGWYDDLNSTRSAFFEAEGLIDREACKTHLPASTGIGMYGANGASVTLDLIAMPGAEDEIQLLEAGGDQQSAFDYGSAFSRAAIAPMPAGKTLFISGTAAINPEGETEHVGRIEAQVDDTIAHVRALLKQGSCGDDQVLMALVYCKTPEIEQVFKQRWPDLPWPRITMIGDVCRPELLFEVEVTAGPACLNQEVGQDEVTDATDGNGKV